MNLVQHLTECHANCAPVLCSVDVIYLVDYTVPDDLE